MAKVLTAYNWECVVWIDSLNNIGQITDDFGVAGYLSPIHNMDGGRPHLHWIMCYDRQRTYDQVMYDIELAGLSGAVNTVKYVKSLSTRCRYLCHLDTPKKYQYSTDCLSRG